MQKKRIEFIDALRGFTMILVVFQHIESFSLKLSPPTFICQILMQFRMPLFFFISGYIVYKANQIYDFRNYLTLCFKKIKIQLIPTLIFGLLYTYITLGMDFNDFIAPTLKLGYWFTLTLLGMFLIYYTTSFIYYKVANTITRRISIEKATQQHSIVCVWGGGGYYTGTHYVSCNIFPFKKTFLHNFP